MPQKKNADSLELIRGKTGRIFGRVSSKNASFENILGFDSLQFCFGSFMREKGTDLF